MCEENKRITIMLFKVLSFTDLNYVTLIDKQTNYGVLLSEGSSIDHLGNNTWLALVTQLSFVTIKQTKVAGGHEMKFHCNKSVEIKQRAESYGISINKLSIPTLRYPSRRVQTHRHQFSYKLRFVVWRFKWHSDMPEVIKEILPIFHAGMCSQQGRISLSLTSVQMHFFCGCRSIYV
jgi:hypothetical protein